MATTTADVIRLVAELGPVNGLMALRAALDEIEYDAQKHGLENHSVRASLELARTAIGAAAAAVSSQTARPRRAGTPYMGTTVELTGAYPVITDDMLIEGA